MIFYINGCEYKRVGLRIIHVLAEQIVCIISVLHILLRSMRILRYPLFICLFRHTM